MPKAKIIRLGLTNTSISKPPIIEFVNGSWRVWTAYNPSMTEGTRVELGVKGAMRVVTIKPDGTEEYRHLV